MDSTTKVAVIRSDRRRGAVAEALALIADDLRQSVELDSKPVIVPNLDNPERPWTCTHRDTLSATADAILTAGASSVTIAGGTGRKPRFPRDQFGRLGYRSELWGRPATFLDLDSHAADDDGPWTTVEWTGPRDEPISLRLCSRVAAARCRVVLGVARTHGVYRVGLTLTNLTGVYHPDAHDLPGTAPGIDGGLMRLPFSVPVVAEACADGWFGPGWD